MKVDAFAKLKTEKVRKIVKREKFILKTKAHNSFSSISMERAHQNHPKNVLPQKTLNNEFDGFTKSWPFCPNQFVNLFTYIYINLFIYPFIYPFIYLSIY